MIETETQAVTIKPLEYALANSTRGKTNQAPPNPILSLVMIR